MTVRDRLPAVTASLERNSRINREMLHQAGGALGILTAAAVLTITGGVAGLTYGIAAGFLWVITPPVFAFIVAQAGLAAVTGTPLTPLVAAAELGLVGVLASDLQRFPRSAHAVAAIGGLCGVLVVTWVTVQSSMLAATAVVIVGCSVVLYAVHRYELIRTGKLPQ